MTKILRYRYRIAKVIYIYTRSGESQVFSMPISDPHRYATTTLTEHPPDHTHQTLCVCASRASSDNDASFRA